MVVRKVGKYEMGRTIGEGTFAKVKYAQNTESGESVAMKVLDKETILKHKMVDQIKREISVMKLVRHPNVVRLHEVLASRGKIYIVLEFVTGGELFDKIVHQGRLSEGESRKYFQQLVDAVDFCHSKGVYHRDLKPENLLLDTQGRLKISDFGLSALPQQVRDDGLLHTTCGTPNYVAPEVLNDKGYDGAVADVWSCGVILYVLIAGFLPFDEADLLTLYRKIHLAEFLCPPWFSPGVKSLILQILDPNPHTRITISGIRKNEWFIRGYVPERQCDEEEINLDDVQAVFNDSESAELRKLGHLLVGPPNSSRICSRQQRTRRHFELKDQFVDVAKEYKDLGPSMMNAFELITLSQGLNLSVLFDKRLDHVRRQTCFTSKKPAKQILSRMTEVASNFGFKVQSRNYKVVPAHFHGNSIVMFCPSLPETTTTCYPPFIVAIACDVEFISGSQQMRLEGLNSGKPGQLGQMAVAIEVFEVVPSLYMVEVRKAVGDTLEYHKFYKSFCSQLKDITWISAVGSEDTQGLVSSVNAPADIVVAPKHSPRPLRSRKPASLKNILF